MIQKLDCVAKSEKSELRPWVWNSLPAQPSARTKAGSLNHEEIFGHNELLRPPDLCKGLFPSGFAAFAKLVEIIETL
jgi:hypothetical protein